MMLILLNKILSFFINRIVFITCLRIASLMTYNNKYNQDDKEHSY